MSKANASWTSPDGRIRKEVITEGEWGRKPYYNTDCSFKISQIEKTDSILTNLIKETPNPQLFILGFAETPFDREVEKCLLQMRMRECSKFQITLGESAVSFTIELRNFSHKGLIHEWDAKMKLDWALKYKMKGVELFKIQRVHDSSFLFSRALKLLLSIPIPVDVPPVNIHGIPLSTIKEIRANLYNNLASCNLKCENHENVVELCSRVLKIEKENVKALYKRGVSWEAIGEYEKAKQDMEEVLKLDESNTAAAQRIKTLNVLLAEQNKNYNVMVKKMFNT